MDWKKLYDIKINKAFSHGWKPIVTKLKRKKRENKFIWFPGRVNIVVRNGKRMCKRALEGNRVAWYIQLESKDRKQEERVRQECERRKERWKWKRKMKKRKRE